MQVLVFLPGPWEAEVVHLENQRQKNRRRLWFFPANPESDVGHGILLPQRLSKKLAEAAGKGRTGEASVERNQIQPPLLPDQWLFLRCKGLSYTTEKTDYFTSVWFGLWYCGQLGKASYAFPAFLPPFLSPHIFSGIIFLKKKKN